jgi:hypothetical protein
VDLRVLNTLTQPNVWSIPKFEETLAYRDPDNSTLCIFADASQLGWGGVLTQIPHGDITKGIDEQSHQPLMFLSGIFRGAQLH